MYFIGCTTEATIGTLEIYSNYEYVPTLAYYGLIPVKQEKASSKEVPELINTISKKPDLVTNSL